MEEERQRKAAVRKSKMESGLTMEDEEQLEKKAVREGKRRERKKEEVNTVVLVSIAIVKDAVLRCVVV